jgi:predicted acyltransferase (DUF342 family)
MEGKNTMRPEELEHVKKVAEEIAEEFVESPLIFAAKKKIANEIQKAYTQGFHRLKYDA